MTSHLGFMILFAACVAAVFGTLLRESSRDQIQLAMRIFGGLTVGALAVGWLMHFAF